MKNFFSSSAKIFKYAITIIAAIILAGSVVVGVLNFNKSVDLGGGYYAKVTFVEPSEYQNLKEKTSEAITSKGYKIVSAELERSTASDSVVIKFKAKQVDVQALKTAIAEKAGITEALIDINSFSHSYSYNKMTLSVVILAVVALGLFVFGAIRKGTPLAVTLLVGFVADMLACVSLVAITRIELSITILYLPMIFALAKFVIFEFCRLRAENIVDAENVSFTDALNRVTFGNKWLYLAGNLVLLVMFAIFTILGDRALMMAGFAGIISVVVSAVMLIAVDLPLYVTLLNTKAAKQKAVMSRNKTASK